ncbi:hypothetical protein GCM10009733_107360 [Nonomuraea maheshkhaliensis]|uniref:Uncharacterized protein n=1 Tax=Nonomuraea maheshkhaliensis TaxID=419590 RepID=A0ABN2HV58_9ACTN
MPGEHPKREDRHLAVQAALVIARVGLWIVWILFDPRNPV